MYRTFARDSTDHKKPHSCNLKTNTDLICFTYFLSRRKVMPGLFFASFDRESLWLLPTDALLLLPKMVVVVHQMPNGIISIITKSSRLVHHNFGRYRKGTVAHTGKRSIKPKILGQKKTDSLAEIGTAMLGGARIFPEKKYSKVGIRKPLLPPFSGKMSILSSSLL